MERGCAFTLHENGVEAAFTLHAPGCELLLTLRPAARAAFRARVPGVRFDERLPPRPPPLPPALHRTARQDPAGVPYGLLMLLRSGEGLGLYYRADGFFWIDNWGNEIPSGAIRPEEVARHMRELQARGGAEVTEKGARFLRQYGGRAGGGGPRGRH